MIILSGISTLASAQVSARNASKNKSAGRSSKNMIKQKRNLTDSLDNRKNYEWKNGQKATPTGEEATGVNSNNFVSPKKDTGKLRKKVKM